MQLQTGLWKPQCTCVRDHALMDTILTMYPQIYHVGVWGSVVVTGREDCLQQWLHWLAGEWEDQLSPRSYWCGHCWCQECSTLHRHWGECLVQSPYPIQGRQWSTWTYKLHNANGARVETIRSTTRVDELLAVVSEQFIVITAVKVKVSVDLRWVSSSSMDFATVGVFQVSTFPVSVREQPTLACWERMELRTILTVAGERTTLQRHTSTSTQSIFVSHYH